MGAVGLGRDLKRHLRQWIDSIYECIELTNAVRTVAMAFTGVPIFSALEPLL